MAVGSHLLNLRTLASEDIADYSLLRFEGREAISEPFDYQLELVPVQTNVRPEEWIGKLAEFDITIDDEERVFAGRIYETRQVATGAEVPRILLRVRPAYHAVSYGRATQFVQDRSSIEIFASLTDEVPGLVTDISMNPSPPKRGYAVRYDESEFDFLDRLLAQDGTMYFFTYDRAAGPYRHKMHIANHAGVYTDVPGADDNPFQPSGLVGTARSIEHQHRAFATKHDYHAFDVNKLDTPWLRSAEIGGTWGAVYAHPHEDLAGEALAKDDNNKRGSLHNEAYAQEAELIAGAGDDIAFFAGGRISSLWRESGAGGQLVLTSVTHSAYDPWMLHQGGRGTYANRFTAMDAAKAFRPPAPRARKRAPGPVLGVVTLDAASPGEAKIDDQSRIPVAIAPALNSSSAESSSPVVIWLPVQQQWAHGTHGAQFFPRIGARVIVDFLYGDPDLPFVAGTMYTPSQPYPFDPASKATQSGWKSVTDKNGSITQHVLFEDKPGGEEINLYTGRDYRRLIDNNDWGTVQNNQTLVVGNDQTQTVKHDQTETIDNDQTLTVNHDQAITIQNDRTLDVSGKEATTIQKTRTTTVTQKSLLESFEEIELKVGASSIKMTLDKIVITSPQIEIKASATLKTEGSAMAEHKAGALMKVEASGPMTINGAIVMIN